MNYFQRSLNILVKYNGMYWRTLKLKKLTLHHIYFYFTFISLTTFVFNKLNKH